MNKRQHHYKLSLIIFWQYLLHIVGSSTGEVFNICALTIEIREDYDLFLVVLAEILWNYHVVMRIYVVQFNDVVVSPEIIGNFALKGGRGESSPKDLLALDHGLVRLRYASIEVKVPALFGISFKFSGKLFLIILLELFFDGSDDSRDLFILTFPEKLIHFLIGMISGIKIDKTLQCSILFILFESLLCHTFLPIISYFFQHK